MDRIPFIKMSGSGNDFIIIDNRKPLIDEDVLNQFIINVCRRKMSAGADGLILVEPSESADFRWRFYNSDGSRAEMCGNGARCAARYAHMNGIAGKKLSFQTDVGLVAAEIIGNRVKVKMTDPSSVTRELTVELKSGRRTMATVNTGVPHVVLIENDLKMIDVCSLGHEIRYHDHFEPAGTNVNFITDLADNTISIRTYERGVEDETLACGTGSVAGALVTADRLGLRGPIHVKTRSGITLTVHFSLSGGVFKDVYLEGDARIIYSGEMWSEAWE
jgi:diaminopimelate epimerase